MATPGDLVFAPLGGVGEIGMNLSIYGLGDERRRSWLIVDVGVSFANEENLPGIDLILPDIRFLVAERRNLAGIVLTHAHEDHFGALLDLWPKLRVPVYATPFTAALLAAKRLGEPGAPDIPVTQVALGSRFEVGPFDIELVSVAHSIPESNALIIRTPHGAVLHTGDWKLDPTPVLGPPTDEAKLRALGEEGCIALIGDSTNAVREGRSPSESDVAKTLAELIMSAPGRVAVTTFASNVARLKAVAAAAHRAGREVVIIGRAIHRSVDVARELGYLDGFPEFLDQDAYASLPRNKVVALLTGSQGEPRAALARIASADHRYVTLSPGDRVIFSSRTIPGNERAVNTIINALVDFGAEVITDRQGLVHTSGHPRRDEIRQLYDWIKPRIVIPVHGEALHLHEQAKLARAAGIPQVIEARNGRMIRLAPGPAEALDTVAHGKLYRDGRLLVAHEASGVVERRRLSFAGIVSIAIVLSDSGDVLEDPLVMLVGLPEGATGGEPFRKIVESAVDDALDALPKPKRRDAGLVQEAVRRAVRAEIDMAWGKKPATIVHVVHVSD